MIERKRAARSTYAARIAVAGVFLAGGALGLAGQAAADPDVPPAPNPGDVVLAPGQPAAAAADAPVGPPAPPPVGPPVVPEIANPQFGSGSGPIGSLKDIWHEVRDGDLSGMDPNGPGQGALAPPPGAGPAPKLPPGFTSLTDPSSSTPALPKDPNAVGPTLPPGYYPLNGPPPPDYAPATAPGAAVPADAPVPSP
jgi:hypothetical protein